jgi:hypothetical protein
MLPKMLPKSIRRSTNFGSTLVAEEPESVMLSMLHLGSANTGDLFGQVFIARARPSTGYYHPLGGTRKKTWRLRCAGLRCREIAHDTQSCRGISPSK